MSDRNAALYKLSDVQCSYGNDVPVFQTSALEIPKGRITAIVGESGAGKSTLLHLLGKLHPAESAPDSVFTFFGTNDGDPIDLFSASPGKHCSFLFQTSNLFEDATIDLNLALLADKKIDQDKKQALLEELDLINGSDGRIARRVRDLSGGQKRRLAIAGAILRDKNTILADELTSDLDPVWTERCLDLLQRWQKENQARSLIWVTHDHERARHYADQVLIIQKNGRISAANLMDDETYRPLDWELVSQTRLTELISSENAEPIKRTSADLSQNVKRGVRQTLLPSLHDCGLAMRFALEMSVQAVKIYSGRLGFLRTLKSALSSLRTVPQLVIFICILCLASVSYNIWDFVQRHVEDQRGDPNVQHFVIVQNLRAGQILLTEPKQLGSLRGSLLSLPGASLDRDPFVACDGGLPDDFRDLSPGRAVYGRLNDNLYVNLPDNRGTRSDEWRLRTLIVEADEPLLRCLRIKAPNGQSEEETAGKIMINNQDQFQIVLSRSAYERLQRNADDTTLEINQIVFQGDRKARETPIDLIGIFDDNLYSSRFAVEAIIPRSNYDNWRGYVGLSLFRDQDGSKVYDEAAVYFSEDTASDTISVLEEGRFIFNREAYQQFLSLINLRNVIEGGFAVFALIVVFSVFSTIAFLTWLFLSQLSRPIGILVTHGRPATIILLSFILQVILSLIISAGFSLAILRVLGESKLINIVGEGLVIDTVRFAEILFAISVGAIVGAIASFIIWKSLRPHPLQMLK